MQITVKILNGQEVRLEVCGKLILRFHRISQLHKLDQCSSKFRQNLFYNKASLELTFVNHCTDFGESVGLTLTLFLCSFLYTGFWKWPDLTSEKTCVWKTWCPHRSAKISIQRENFSRYSVHIWIIFILTWIKMLHFWLLLLWTAAPCERYM